jgi:hypothetical protein
MSALFRWRAVRVSAFGQWVPISRALIDDVRLQFDTRAIASWLIAKPDGWEIRLVAPPYLLQQRAGPGEHVGRDRVRRMLRELENAGRGD